MEQAYVILSKNFDDCKIVFCSAEREKAEADLDRLAKKYGAMVVDYDYGCQLLLEDDRLFTLESVAVE